MSLIEVRWHGRGGQGVVTGSNLLARAAIQEGKYAQHFPEFGPERAGAPVRSYTRISDEPIEIHCGVYEPDIVVIIDPVMSKFAKEYCQGLKKGGDILLNYIPEEDAEIVKWVKENGCRLHVVDARKISLEEINREIYNVPMLAALIRVRGLCKISTLEEVLAKRFSRKIFEMNLKISRRAYEEVKTIVG
ncbi:MAG: 2-oxoacid:acceptor oxidoreductase family protein [Thaumarchaeota archaeon]|nr:2-oxoacid:acceptor oxidoreductase family protein [Nitrososphaerota archaeon]